VWSPDGTKIAFGSVRDDPTGRIYTVNYPPDGADPVQLTNDQAWYPFWSQDGTHIALISNRDDPAGEMYVMDYPGGGNLQRVTHNQFWDAEPGGFLMTGIDHPSIPEFPSAVIPISTIVGFCCIVLFIATRSRLK